MNFLALLQQPRPVLLLHLLLAQYKLDLARRVVRLAVFDINLSVEFELDMIGGLFGRRSAGEG